MEWVRCLGVSYGRATVSFTNKNIPANPANNTAVSYPTDTWCNRLNSTRLASFSGVFCTDTISIFNRSIRLLTVNCDAAVSTTINTTHKAAAVVKLPKSRVRASRATRNSNPRKIPA